jgi:hypothetical protein
MDIRIIQEYAVIQLQLNSPASSPCCQQYRAAVRYCNWQMIADWHCITNGCNGSTCIFIKWVPFAGIDLGAACLLVLERIADTHNVGWLLVWASSWWHVADVLQSCEQQAKAIL